MHTRDKMCFYYLTFLTFMPLSFISLMRFPWLVVASKWKVYWLAPAAAMGFTHCSGRDTIMCISATSIQLCIHTAGQLSFSSWGSLVDQRLDCLTKERVLAYCFSQAFHHGVTKRDVGDKVPVKGSKTSN